MDELGQHKKEALIVEVQDRWGASEIKAPRDRSFWRLHKELSDAGVIDFEGS